MKKLVYNLRIFTVLFLLLGLSSCDALLDDELTDYGTGPNFVGFADTELTLSAVTDGESYERIIPIAIIGPSVPSIDGPVTVTVSVAPSSTAVEGTHFVLDQTTVTLTPSESEDDLYIGELPITILTEGIQAPLEEAPVLVLNLNSVESEDDVVINDKAEVAAVTLAYACPYSIEDYAGTYIATTDEFGIYIGETTPFEVVVGPGENQITLVNFANHPEEYDLVINVDPATGALTIPKQEALNYNNFGATQYGVLSMEGTGYSMAANGFCIGEFGYRARYTVAAGSFGNFRLAFEKLPEEGGEETGDGDTTEE